MLCIISYAVRGHRFLLRFEPDRYDEALISIDNWYRDGLITAHEAGGMTLAAESVWIASQDVSVVRRGDGV